MKEKIIAELCQNHNGSRDRLLQMVEAVARTGATHAKVQAIYAEDLTFRPQFEHGLTRDSIVASIKRPYAAEFSRLKGLELDREDIKEFVAACKGNGLIPSVTCFARHHIKELASLGFASVKVASYDCASFQLLREVRDNFSEIIVSTGASYDDEIEYATQVLKGTDFELLHCVTIYPTPLAELNLARMNFLRSFAPRVGFSDHSLFARDGILASKAALALGANTIERHFTILPEDKTKDGPVSINETALRELVEFATLPLAEREAELAGEWRGHESALGQERREMTVEEQLNRDYYRGRFASNSLGSLKRKVFNWEEVPVPACSIN